MSNQLVLDRPELSGQSPEMFPAAPLRLYAPSELNAMDITELATLAGTTPDDSVPRVDYVNLARRSQMRQFILGTRAFTLDDAASIAKADIARITDITDQIADVQVAASDVTILPLGVQETDDDADFIETVRGFLRRDHPLNDVSPEEIADEKNLIPLDAAEIGLDAATLQDDIEAASIVREPVLGRVLRSAEGAVVALSLGQALAGAERQSLKAVDTDYNPDHRTGHWVAKKLGQVAAIATLFTIGSLFGSPEKQTTSSAESNSVTEATIDMASPVTTSTIETVVAPDVEVTVEIPTTTTVRVTSTTTEPPIVEATVPAPEVVKPKSLLQQVYDQDISIWDTAGKRFDTLSMSIPGLCLENIHIYGSNFASIDNKELQQSFFIPSGLMTQDQANRINNGSMPYVERASIYEQFDPTYFMSIAEKPQEPCDEVSDSANPPRWEMMPTGSQTALNYANFNDGISLANVQPIAELDLETGVLPGQKGNMTISAHNRTQQGTFWNIDSLHVGDDITMAVEGQGRYVYRVEATGVVDPSMVEEVMNYSSPSGVEETLTLYGCGKTETGVSTRQVVRAVLVEKP